ncbi:phospholipase D family protein [Bartonella grahamii]|uniref:Phospholipase D n=2 Tax=Bartonella grahamii TaxID=33045 RepID=A0A336NCB5_BARGR|nr:phospholipase D family protein [Bartonella grahamii]ACS50557.1 phopholipase D family protein [Bartonella grahamii as4aup]SSZ40023.1 Cardiolipin synthase [Bartonella grahamii]
MTLLHIVIGFVLFFLIASMLAIYTYGRFMKNARGQCSYALPIQKDETKLDRIISQLAEEENGLGIDKDALSLIISNLDAFCVRAIGAAEAGRSLDLMYYIWDDDLTGRLLLSEIVKAADRGVRVRLLLDDINAQARDPAYIALDKHPHIEVRVFNPGRSRKGGLRRGLEIILRAITVTRRMHNKAFIVDGRIAFVGGRNLADSYFDAGEESHFRDLDLMLIGPSVKKVESIFDDFWNSAVVLPIHTLVIPKSASDLSYWRDKLQKFRDSKVAKVYLDYVKEHINFDCFIQTGRRLFLADKVVVLSDPPEKALRKKASNWLMKALSKVIGNAQKTVQITSPYFVPGKVGTQNFSNLVSKGVDVKILTNSLAATDVALVHGGYVSYRKALLKSGVKLYELKAEGNTHGLRLFRSSKASLHAKAFLIDRKTAFIGSLNFDPRSASLNTEMGILFECAPITARLDLLFSEETTGEMSYHLRLGNNNRIYWDFIENEKKYSIDHEPESNFWRRAFAKIISWLPIESQL